MLLPHSCNDHNKRTHKEEYVGFCCQQDDNGGERNQLLLLLLLKVVVCYCIEYG